jgi:hypothetical protein
LSILEVPAVLWSAVPAADPTPAPVTLDEAAKQAGEAAGWVEQNWSTWLSTGLRILLILVVAVVLRHLVRRALTKLIERMNRSAQAVEGSALGGLLVNAERRRQRSEAIGSVLRSVASFLIMGTAGLMILGAFNVNLAPLLASAGVAGVAIGFGARNLVTDFLSGVFMILEDQYGVGDSVDAGVASGEVIEVGLRVTKLRGDNGEIWYVRNGEIKRIGNLSQGWSTATVDVTVRPTGGALERAPLGAGRGAGSHRGAAGLHDGPARRQDDAGQVPGGRARAALAHQAGLRRGRHPHRGRPSRGPGRGRPRGPDGVHGAPVGLRLDHVAAVGRGDPAEPAAEPDEVAPVAEGRPRRHRRGRPSSWPERVLTGT